MTDYKLLKHLTIMDLVFNILMSIGWIALAIVKSVLICTTQIIDGWDCAVIISSSIVFGVGIMSIIDSIQKIQKLNEQIKEQNETVD